MHARTRSQQPILVGGLEEIKRKKRGKKKVDVVHQQGEESIEGNDVERIRSSPLVSPKVKNQQGGSKGPPQQGSEKVKETEPSSKQGLEGTNMDAPPPPPDPPVVEPIDPLVRPKGLPILVPRDLAELDMPSNLPKFWGTKDEDPSRHMERYIERLASSLITNPGYCLVWFPTTLQGEAYEWYRDHPEGHFREWVQMQREFLNEFRPEVGQSTALRALASLKQGRDEEISAYIRRFDLVCTRFVGTMLNDDTLKQFFIQ